MAKRFLSNMLQMYRIHTFSIYYYIVRTISYLYIVLSFIKTLPLRLHLKSTLLSSSLRFFFLTMISIVSEPYTYCVLDADCPSWSSQQFNRFNLHLSARKHKKLMLLLNSLYIPLLFSTLFFNFTTFQLIPIRSYLLHHQLFLHLELLVRMILLLPLCISYSFQ